MNQAKFLARFELLTDYQRTLLALIALHGHFRRQHDLFAVARNCPSLASFDDQPIQLTAFREQLKEVRWAGLLSHDGFRVHDDTVHPLCAWAATTGTLGELDQPLANSLRFTAGGFFAADPVVVSTKVRLAFYGGDQMRLEETLQEYGDAADAALQWLLRRITPTWVDSPSFSSFSVRTRFHMVSQAVAARLLQLRSCENWLTRLADLHDEIGLPTSIPIGMARLLQGQSEEARRWLVDEKDPEVLAALSCVALADRDVDLARELHLRAYERLASATRKRYFYFSTLAGPLSFVSLLANPDPSELTAQVERLHKATRQKGIGNEQWLLERLIRVCEVLLGRRDPLCEPRYFRRNRTDLDGLLWLFTEHWMRDPELAIEKSTDLAKEAKSMSEYYRDNGYAWLAAECGVLKDRLCGVPSTGPVRHLADFAPQPENWQNALAALEAIARKASKDAKTSPQERLVWRIDDTEQDDIEIRPVIQKRGKTRWTKGREISVDTLLKNLARYDFLSAHDRRVCARVERGRQSGHHFTCVDADDALAALVAHPLVFHEGDHVNPLELRSRNVVLKVTRDDANMRLDLDPPIAPGESVRIIRNSPLSWDVISIDEAMSEVAALFGETGVNVPLDAEDRVKRTVGALASRFDIRGDVADLDALIPTIDPCPHLFMQVTPEGEELDFRLLACPLGLEGPSAAPGTGAAAMIAETAPGEPHQTTRDLGREKALANNVTSMPELAPIQCAPGVWRSSDPRQSLEALAALRALGDDTVQLTWPRGETLKVNRPSENLALNIGAGGDWFEVDGSLPIDGGRVLELRLLLNMLDDAQGRFLKLDDGQFLALSERLFDQLKVLRAHSQTRGKKTRIHPLSASRLDDFDDVDLAVDRAWQDQCRRIVEAEGTLAELPTTLTAQLREYQVDGFRWLMRLSLWGAGACLADDMGLGKTVQTLAALVARAAAGPALVIAPTSVCSNWIDECYRFAPTLNPIRYGGSDRDQAIADCGPFDVMIASYGLLQHDHERIASRPWHTLVLDEAQAIKNPRTRRARAAGTLKADFKVALSGTPVENHLGDLWSLFNVINPGLLGSWEHYRRRFVGPIDRGDADVREGLRRLIAPFVMRRLKTDVLTELPPRTEVIRHVALSEEETALYESVRARALERIAGNDQKDQQQFRVLAELTRLRQACCHPDLINPRLGIPSSKLKTSLEIIDELRENRHKALVFSQFTSHLALLRAALDKLKITYQYLDGSTPAKKREAAVAAFQDGQGDLFLISLKAGGTGLNLTAADYVIHLDPWWNPAAEDQASDRAHRIGQQRPVTIYRLVAEGTVEDKIVALHARKRELAESLLSGADQGLKLSTEDVLELLQEAG